MNNREQIQELLEELLKTQSLEQLKWKLLTDRERARRTVGVEFKSEEGLKRAYEVIDNRDLPYEMILEAYALVVPDFVREELREAGVPFHEFKYINTAYASEDELKKLRG